MTTQGQRHNHSVLRSNAWHVETFLYIEKWIQLKCSLFRASAFMWRESAAGRTRPPTRRPANKPQLQMDSFPQRGVLPEICREATEFSGLSDHRVVCVPAAIGGTNHTDQRQHGIVSKTKFETEKKF